MRLCLDRFSYPGETAAVLQGLDLAVAGGECVLVAGGSGSGKSTLARILAGVLPGRHGGVLSARFEVAGECLTYSGSGGGDAGGGGAARANPRINPAVWNRHIAYVGQDPAAQLSTVASTVAEEIAFALENAGVPRGTMVERVRATAQALGLTALLQRSPAELSGGEQRRLAIAAAAVLNPATLVLDEPMAGLDARARRSVEQMIASLLAGGAGVVLMSAELGGAGRLADRVLLLDGGRQVTAGPRREVLHSAAAARLPVIPDPLEPAADPSEAAPGASRLPPAGPGRPAVASLQAVVYRYGTEGRRRWPGRQRHAEAAGPTVLDGASLELRAGERVAIAGANGAGKSTLLRHLNGLARPERGRVRIQGRDIAAEAVGSVAADVGYLFQDPRDQLFERTVAREVAYGVAERDPQLKGALVQQALVRCGLDHVAGAHPYELPSSAQRLVALATVLARRPQLLALDEPTVAMDREGLERLAEAMRTEAERGAAVAVVTHDLDFAYRQCTRLVLLAGGRIVADGPFETVLAAHFGAGEAFGVQAPVAWSQR